MGKPITRTPPRSWGILKIAIGAVLAFAIPKTAMTLLAGLLFGWKIALSDYSMLGTFVGLVGVVSLLAVVLWRMITD